LTCGNSIGIRVVAANTGDQSNNLKIDAIDTQNCVQALLVSGNADNGPYGNNSTIQNSRIVSGGIVFTSTSAVDPATLPQGWLVSHTGSYLWQPMCPEYRYCLATPSASQTIS